MREDHPLVGNTLEARGPPRSAEGNAGGEVQQVSDRIRILSDRPSDRKPNDPGRPARRCWEADLACGERWSAEDASGLPDAQVRSTCVSRVTSSSCGIWFSAGEESSFADSGWPPVAIDISPGTGATSTNTSHARQARATVVKVRYECTSMIPRTSHTLGIDVRPARCSPINILSPRQRNHGVEVDGISLRRARDRKSRGVKGTRRGLLAFHLTRDHSEGRWKRGPSDKWPTPAIDMKHSSSSSIESGTHMKTALRTLLAVVAGMALALGA